MTVLRLTAKLGVFDAAQIDVNTESIEFIRQLDHPNPDQHEVEIHLRGGALLTISNSTLEQFWERYRGATFNVWL